MPPTNPIPSAFAKDSGQVTTTVELGPETRALLRRLVLGIEQMLDTDIVDPGRSWEQENQDQSAVQQ